MLTKHESKPQRAHAYYLRVLTCAFAEQNPILNNVKSILCHTETKISGMKKKKKQEDMTRRK